MKKDKLRQYYIFPCSKHIELQECHTSRKWKEYFLDEDKLQSKTQAITQGFHQNMRFPRDMDYHQENTPASSPFPHMDLFLQLSDMIRKQIHKYFQSLQGMSTTLQLK